MNTGHINLENSHIANFSHHGSEQIPPTAREVLEELFLLLEDYAPTWYTEELHSRTVAALLIRDK